MRKARIEADAADALLDNRLKVYLPAPWLLRIFGVRRVPIFPKQPVAENLFRMARLFVRMDIDAERLMEGNFGPLLRYVGKHGVTVSRIIALGLIRGSLAARLFHRPLAWYIRSHMTLRGMAELARILVLMSTAESFVPIIRSVGSLNLLEPTLSRETRTGS